MMSKIETVKRIRAVAKECSGNTPDLKTVLDFVNTFWVVDHVEQFKTAFPQAVLTGSRSFPYNSGSMGDNKMAFTVKGKK